MQNFVNKTASKILFVMMMIVSTHIFAWIYPEHRDITLLGVQKLDHEDRAL